MASVRKITSEMKKLELYKSTTNKGIKNNVCTTDIYINNAN